MKEKSKADVKEIPLTAKYEGQTNHAVKVLVAVSGF